MRIYYWANEDLSLPGGAATHVLEVVRNLEEQGHEVCLFVRQRSKDEEIKFVEIPYLKSPRFLRNPSVTIVLLFALFLHSLRKRPDIFYSRHCPSTISIAIVSFFLRRPLISEVNGILPDEVKMKGRSWLTIAILRLVEKFNLRMSKAVVAVTKGIKQYLAKTGISASKIWVISNGVNVDLFAPQEMKKCQSALNLNTNTQYIGFIGNLAPWQGLDLLVKALPNILRNFPDVVALIVGDGAQKSKLKNHAAKLELTSNVHFIPRTSYNEVPAFINSFNFCVAPFTRERNVKIGLSPLKIYGYMACGKAFVTSRVPGLTELVENYNCGLLFEPDNPDDLAEKIITLLSDRKLCKQLGKNGRKAAVENFSWKHIAQQVAKVCEKAMIS